MPARNVERCTVQRTSGSAKIIPLAPMAGGSAWPARRSVRYATVCYALSMRWRAANAARCSARNTRLPVVSVLRCSVALTPGAA